VANAKVVYSALCPAREHLHSSCNSVAFGCELIPNKNAFPSHTEEARWSWVSREDVSSCVFPEAMIPVGSAGEEEGWCLQLAASLASNSRLLVSTEKEESRDEEDFVFGAYQPTVASTPEGRPSRRQSVRYGALCASVAPGRVPF